MKIARLLDKEQDFIDLNMKKEIEQWEDGLHTTGKFGEYEWWYTDCKIDGGGSIVIIFYSQPVTASKKGFAYSITANLNIGDKEIKAVRSFDKKDCKISKEKCSIVFDDCYLEGDLNNYKLHYKDEQMDVTLNIYSNTFPWRPGCGRIKFGKKKYFAWLPAVPEGKVTGEIILDGKKIDITGTGYRDHNWGNTGMFWLMHHWYWGRAKIGEYQAITSYITARKKYGYEHFPIFLLCKNGKKIGDNTDFMTYKQEDPCFDENTKKHYHKKITYTYDDGNEKYIITYNAKNVIEFFNTKLAKTSVQAKAGSFLLFIVKLLKVNPSYVRIEGEVSLEKVVDGKVVERVVSPGIWEQMHFGLDEDV